MRHFQSIGGLGAVWIAVFSVSTGCVAAPTNSNPPTLAVAPLVGKTVTLATDGTGNYQTLQAALDSIPDGNKERVIIRIKPGVYKEKIQIPREKGPISLVGENVATTILSFDDAASTVRDGKAVGTSGSYSIKVQSPDFVAENITIENSAGQRAGQAVALFMDGDRAIFRKCRLLGWQDTLYTGAGRHYFEDCTIAGSVDYIFGGATSWFERCTLQSRANGCITAASTPENQSFGYVFSNCTVVTDPGVKIQLGRTWRAFANVAFLNTKMSPSVDAVGWNNWGNPANDKTARYSEFNSTTPEGAPTDTSLRVLWAKQLTAKEAADYTIPNVLGGVDGQKPFSEKPVWRPINIKPPITSTDGVLNAGNVSIHGANAQKENDGANIGYWNNSDTRLVWQADLKPGSYALNFSYSLDGSQAGSEISIKVGDKTFTITPAATGGWTDYQTVSIGEAEIGQGVTPITVSANSQKKEFILNLREVTLVKK